MKKLFLLMTAFLAAEGAHAAGFEKSVMWSGKYAGVAGAAVSSVTGGQSLYFNPAGLAGPGDISLNYSPTWIKTTGYLSTSTQELESKTGALPFGGAMASYSMGKFGFGMGYYVVGGEKAFYGDVDLSGNAGSGRTVEMRPSLFTDLEVTEYSFGGAIELMPGLRAGASWRVDKATGGLATVKKNLTNTAYSFLVVKDIKQTQYDGWRLGVQYQDAERNWGVGASYRSKVKFDAPGKASGSIYVIPFHTTTAMSFDDTVRIGLTFPEAYSFGGNCKIGEHLGIFTGVDLVKYSRDDYIYVVGVGAGSKLPNIPLQWEDMWNFRLGFEYTGMSALKLRAGYSLTTQVTSGSHAKATLPPAGKGHLVAAGAGYSVTPNLDIDGALEHSWNNGSGQMSMPTATDTSKELLSGVTTETKARVYAIHTGVTYRF